MKNSLRTLFICSLMFSAVMINAQTVKTGLFFEQSGDYVRIPNHSAYAFGTGSFSLEMWIQADTGQAYNPFLLHKKDTATNATGFALAISSMSKLTVEIAGGGHNTGFGFGGPNIVDGNCHHIVYTRDVSGASDTVRAYIDGNLVKKSVKDIPSADVTYSTDLFVGWVSGGFGKQDYAYHGMIKELRLWNIARSESEIQATMDKFLDGNESGLVGNWRFYENSGTTVKDYSTNANHGMFGGGTKDPAWQDFCDVINDDLPSGTGEIENYGSQKVSLFPNPAENELNVSLEPGEQINRLRIFNALGKVVMDKQNPNTNGIDISDLHTGIYFGEISLSDDKVVTSRFIKK